MSNDDVPLRDLVDQRWDSHDRVHTAEAEARARALEAMERRLDGMNEFRASLNDIVGHAVPRDLYDQRHTELDRRIQEVERNMVRQDALDQANQELARTRKALGYTIVGGVTVTLIAAVVDVVIRTSAR